MEKKEQNKEKSAYQKRKEKQLEVRQELIPETLKEPMALGDVFVKSGMFQDVKSQAQAVVKILAGRELGLSPLESMTNIYIVNNKVALQAKIIASLIKKSTKYDYSVDKLDDKECTLTFYLKAIDKDGKPCTKEIGKSSFTTADAAKAGIINKDNWKNYTRNMLFARALTNGARWYTSDVFCGYATEEFEKPINVAGTVVLNKKGEVISG